jgi:Holliday junction resolvase
MKESTFQSKVIQWLKAERGCYVIKNTANPGVPLGAPDIFFCKGAFYGFIECKPSKTAKFQVLQKETIAKLDAWNWARVVYPENWGEIQLELAGLIPE